MRWLIILGTTVVLSAAVLGIWTTRKPLSSAGETWRIPEITLTNLDQAFAVAQPWQRTPAGEVRAGIMPHHTLVSPIIAAWFSGLRDQPAPATVVIIGPDHHNAGVGYATTATTDWQTPDGRVVVNRELVRALTVSGDVTLDSILIHKEHGVYTTIPYIHRVWPNAKVVTIALKGDRRPDRLDRLASNLQRLLKTNDLVIASVDFSHYITAVDALREDEQSLAVVAAGDAEAALRIPVDSPPAISLLLRYVNLRKLQYQQLLHTTSAQFTGQREAHSTTSYLSAYFVAKK